MKSENDSIFLKVLTAKRENLETPWQTAKQKS